MRTACRFVIAGPQILPESRSSFYGLLDGWQSGRKPNSLPQAVSHEKSNVKKKKKTDEEAIEYLGKKKKYVYSITFHHSFRSSIL